LQLKTTFIFDGFIWLIKFLLKKRCFNFLQKAFDNKKNRPIFAFLFGMATN